MSKASYEMTIHTPTVCSPYSELAGEICQRVANTAEKCSYPNCKDEVVGCAVHETIIKTPEGYKDGSEFLPICEKHKRWEYAKLKPAEPWGWKI